MGTVKLTADELIAENLVKLKTREITDVTVVITKPGSDSYVVTEKAIVDFSEILEGKIYISGNDTTLGFLYDKIGTNGGIAFNISSAGGNEKLYITNTIRRVIELEDVGLTAEPTSDKILYWDNTSGTWTELAIGTNLTITGGVLNAANSSTPAVEYRADKVTTDANTPLLVTFSSALGTVDADVIVMVNAIDASGNVVIPTVTSVTTTGFTLETATSSTAYYQAFIKK